MVNKREKTKEKKREKMGVKKVTAGDRGDSQNQKYS